MAVAVAMVMCLGYWPSYSRLQSFTLQTCRSYKHERNESSKKADFLLHVLTTTKIRGRNCEIVNTNIWIFKPCCYARLCLLRFVRNATKQRPACACFDFYITEHFRKSAFLKQQSGVVLPKSLIKKFVKYFHSHLYNTQHRSEWQKREIKWRFN